MPQPFTLQDAIAAWLTASQAAPSAPPQAPAFSTHTTPADGVVDMSNPATPKVDWLALATAGAQVAAQPTGAGMASVGAQETPWQNMGLRIGGGLAGGLVGSLGGPVGTAAGAALGTTLMSNEVVQPREVAQGTRPGVSPLVGFAEGASVMLPVAGVNRALPLLRQAPKVLGSAAVGSAVGSAGVQLAESGGVDPMRTLQETALGTALGGGVGFGVAGARRAAASPAAQHLMTSERGSVGPVDPTPAAPRAPETFTPERSLDPTNLPAVVEPRRDLQPAQVVEDIARSTKRNVDVIGMDPVMAREMAEASATPEAWSQRRRIMPVTEMQARANQIDAFDLPKAHGTTLNAEQQLALADTLRAASDQAQNIADAIGPMKDLEAQLATGSPDAAARVAKVAADLGVQGLDGIKRARLEAYDLVRKLHIQDEAAGSEWGRSGRARQVEAKSRQLDDVTFLKQAYKMGAPTQEALDALDSLRGDPDRQRQFLMDLYKPSGQDYWKAYLAFNFLSGPPTLGVNLLSNAVQYARSEASSVMAAGLDAVGGTNARSTKLPPGRLLAASYADGLRHAGHAFVQAMKYGFTDLADTGSIGDGSPEVFKGSWLASALERSGVESEMATHLGRGAANGIKRALLGTDAAFQMLAIYPEAYRKATAAAWNAGLRGADLAAEVQTRIRGLDIHDEVTEPIRRYARGTTFGEKAGGVGTKFQAFLSAVDSLTVKAADTAWEARSGTPVGKSGEHYGAMQVPLAFLHLPFVRIAGALFKDMVRTVTDPAMGAGQLAMGIGDRADNLRTLARGIQTYSLAGTLVALHQTGAVDFTASAPTDNFEREQFYREGKMPWSIGVGGRHVPLQSLGSLGMALAPLGLWLQEGGKDDSPRWTELSAALAKVELDATVVRGAMMLFQGLTDPTKQEKLLGNYVSALMPAGAAGRFVRDSTDPYLRDPGGVGAERRFEGTPAAPVARVVEEMEAQVPGLSTNVRPRLNAWGQPIERPNAWRRVTGSTSKGEDFVADELRRLKVGTADIGRRQEGIFPGDLKRAALDFEKSLEEEINKGVDAADAIPVRLTDQERQQYMTLRGTAIHEALSAVIAPDNPEWANATPKEKKSMVKALKAIGADLAKEMFLESWLGETPQP